MSKDLIQIGTIEERYSQTVHSWNSRLLGYQVSMHHQGLNEHKLLSAPEFYLLESKMSLQVQKWNERWSKEVNLNDATTRTEEAQKNLEEVENILTHSLAIDNTIQWHKLKDKRKFKEKNPIDYLEGTLGNLSQPIKRELLLFPIKPEKKSSEYKVELTFLDKLFSSRSQKKEKLIDEKYKNVVRNWETQCKEIELKNSEIKKDLQSENIKYENQRKHYTNENNKLVENWEKRKVKFYKQQEEDNSRVDRLNEAYHNKSEEAIIEYCERVLRNSEYPSSFPQKFELEYNSTNKILIIEYELPSVECLPKIKEVKFIVNRKKIKETYLSQTYLSKMFDEIIYEITLRTIHELFEADKANVIDAISFNGWVNAVNKATGKVANNCIASIQVKKEEFLEIDLRNVEPKFCFKNLKGVSSSKLSSLIPIQPILQISRIDKRIVDSYNVIDELDNTTNIAIMDWEDFEHLIRELFEKEFQSNGGEVNVTQASRDGGVDAIAFDPDPIRGGKIIIQAKRYTNTVGVAAVRDLYGTVVNEGATKGILVSTADYGPDAYQFAKEKPLTLLNGSNLLHLLEKHGYHAKIDIKEAKKILSEKDKSN
ncbi:MAG: restriction endonuclease [Melioribacteraceae bacterium]